MKSIRGLTSNYRSLLNKQYVIGFVDVIPSSSDRVQGSLSFAYRIKQMYGKYVLITFYLEFLDKKHCWL